MHRVERPGDATPNGSGRCPPTAPADGRNDGSPRHRRLDVHADFRLGTGHHVVHTRLPRPHPRRRPTSPATGDPGTTGNAASSGWPTHDALDTPGTRSTVGTPTTNGTRQRPRAPSTWAGPQVRRCAASAPLTVTGVVAGGPALTAGVIVGDRIVPSTAIDVTTVDEVAAAIKRRTCPATSLRLTVVPRPAGHLAATPGSNGSERATGDPQRSASCSAPTHPPCDRRQRHRSAPTQAATIAPSASSCRRLGVTIVHHFASVPST